MAVEVALTACIAGDPLKSWTDGSEPNDEWEDQSHSFNSIDEAKSWIETLDSRSTTHVRLLVDGDPIYIKDRGDDLASAHVPTSEELQLAERESVPVAPVALLPRTAQ